MPVRYIRSTLLSNIPQYFSYEENSSSYTAKLTTSKCTLVQLSTATMLCTWGGVARALAIMLFHYNLSTGYGPCWRWPLWNRGAIVLRHCSKPSWPSVSYCWWMHITSTLVVSGHMPELFWQWCGMGHIGNRLHQCILPMLMNVCCVPDTVVTGVLRTPCNQE